GTIQLGELATRALLYAWLFVGIPAGVSILVNLLLAPAPRRTVEQAIAERLKLCAEVLRGADEAVRRELGTKVRAGMAPILEQLKFTGIEKSALVRDVSALRQAALSSFALMSAVDALASSPEVKLPGAVRSKLADTVEEMASIVQRGGYPVEVSLELPPEGSVSPLAQELLAAMRDAVVRFAEPEAAAPAPAEKKPGFFVADAFTNPEHVHYALKTTAAALFCYVLYTLLDWPGIHTCFLTVYIVAQSTAAESVEKLSLRLIGCLIGAAAGMAAIVFLVPHLTSIGALLIAVFIGAWAAAYVAAGSPRISYAGFQIAFAFFLCLIQGSGPSFDLTVGRDRIIGIILGNLVAYFTFVYVWPSSISRRVDAALAATFRCLSEVATAKAPAERRLLASQAQGALSDIETDIELARYEPASIRRSAAWLATRRQVVKETQSLGTLLLIGADTREVSRVAAVTRLEQLAASASGEAPGADHILSAGVQAPHGWQTLPARLDRSLRALEEILTPAAAETEGRSHAQA
ncbi:MAG: FUSC family protein, partial [Gammaproteobacteria bacterium]|nr:FUSC family protein [Gammaproteobacteria bacterium]